MKILTTAAVLAATVITPIATATPAQAHISKCGNIFAGSVANWAGNRELTARVSRSCPANGHHVYVQVKGQIMRKVERRILPDYWTPTDSVYTAPANSKTYSGITVRGYCTPNLKKGGNLYRVHVESLVNGPHGRRFDRRDGPAWRINCR